MSEKANFDSWINENIRHFAQLTISVESIIRNIITREGIEVFNVQSRTKSENDCKEKSNRKNYKDPINQITDISGIRIICPSTNDVTRICSII